MTKKENQWLAWATEIQAISQIGLTYCQNPFDIERFNRLMDLAAEIVSEHSELEKEVVKNLFAQEKGYATPKVDVRAAVFRDEKILLVKERTDNLWSVPGGWADVNISPATCVANEVWQEAGFKVKPIKLIALYDMRQHGHPPQWTHIYKACFLCEITGGEARPSIETSEVEFFDRNHLPELSKGRIMAHQIQRFFEHLKNPALPTDFD